MDFIKFHKLGIRISFGKDYRYTLNVGICKSMFAYENNDGLWNSKFFRCVCLFKIMFEVIIF